MTDFAARSSSLAPNLLVGIGVLHLAAAPVVQAGLRPLVSNGLLGAVGDDPAREAAVWYLAAGVALIALGDVGRSAVRDRGALPRRFGAWVLLAGAAVTVTMPASPGWLVMGVGALALGAGRRSAVRPT